MKEHFRHNSNVVFRQFQLGRKAAFLVQIAGFVDKSMLAQSVISRLSDHMGSVTEESILNTIAVPSVETTTEIRAVVQKVLEAQSVLFVDGITVAFTLDVSASEQRNVDEPENEAVIRGPHTGFVENLTVNLSWIFRYLPNPNLRVENYRLGTENKITCVLVYLEGTAHSGIISLVKARLDEIEVDAILGCAYVAQLIQDHPNNIFPTIRHTERPDVVVANLLEGRVAILTQGCPTSLILPHLFLDNFQSVEDYHSERYFSSSMRILRLMAFLVATQLPGLYVSIENFHKELIPSNLLISIAGTREGVPFPLGLEVFIMLLAFELIKESGMRMPKPIASTVSIVGGLILGQAAVDSGLIGIPTVITVAVAGMSGFLAGPLSQPVFLIRLFSLIPSSFVGLYGLILFDLMILLNLSSITSFGVPYMVPLVPTYFPDWKDTFIRKSTKKLHTTNKKRRHNIGRYFEEEYNPKTNH